MMVKEVYSRRYRIIVDVRKLIEDDKINRSLGKPTIFEIMETFKGCGNIEYDVRLRNFVWLDIMVKHDKHLIWFKINDILKPFLM